MAAHNDSPYILREISPYKSKISHSKMINENEETTFHDIVSIFIHYIRASKIAFDCTTKPILLSFNVLYTDLT